MCGQGHIMYDHSQGEESLLRIVFLQDNMYVLFIHVQNKWVELIMNVWLCVIRDQTPDLKCIIVTNDQEWLRMNILELITFL